MRSSLQVLMRSFRAGWIVDIFSVLALEIRGENSMDCAAMNMTRFPMTMISLGMDMEQRDHDGPCHRPDKDHGAQAGYFGENR